MWSCSHLSQQSPETSTWSCLPGGCIDASDPRVSTILSKTRSSSSQLPQRDETEELLISEFNQQSVEEQTKALDDIYSAGSELKENPAMIDRLLTEFEQAVEQANHPIYTIAVNQDSSYVEDPSFRLKFLRANSHDVHKAVDQMTRFLNHKAKCFGVDKLTQDITIEDLTTSDLKLLLSGDYHIQDDTDRQGRPIIFVLKSAQRVNIDSEIRVLYYFFFNVLIPVYSAQMKGAVMVVYDAMKPDNGQHNTSSSPTLPDLARFVDFLHCIPVRLSAFHLCTKREDDIANQLRDACLQFCLKAMPKCARDRARVHSGSPVELQYLLSTYGIPQDTFPVDLAGNRRQGLQNIWFYKHLECEGGISRHFGACNESDDSLSGEEDESSENPALARRAEMEANDGHEGMPTLNALAYEGILANNHLPYTNRDVLLGRGYAVQNHPGNAAFREFLRGHQEEYDSAPRHSKGLIYKSLTRALMTTGVRFWQKSPEGDDTWEEASFEEACKKASQLFRSMRKTLVFNNSNR